MNVCIFSGNVGKDPEVKTSKAGKQYTQFSLGVREWDYAEQQAKTLWVSVRAFGKAGERAAAQLRKGSKVTVHGRVNCHGYTSKIGESAAQLDLIMEDFDNHAPRDSAESATEQPATEPTGSFTPVSGDDMPF